MGPLLNVFNGCPILHQHKNRASLCYSPNKTFVNNECVIANLYS